MEPIFLSDQQAAIDQCMCRLEGERDWNAIESILQSCFSRAPDLSGPQSSDYYDMVNCDLYRFILAHYKHGGERVCFWRFLKRISDDQLQTPPPTPALTLLDHLVRVYFYSGPLDDLSCLFIPVIEPNRISQYLEWIQSYFYGANYPTSLLWLYALDSSLSALFPDELIYLGQRTQTADPHIMLPNLDNPYSVLIKRFSGAPHAYLRLEGRSANQEFDQFFRFLEEEYRERCISRSGRQDANEAEHIYDRGWEKFEDVLRFGVSDRQEKGCVSFSDLRASTEFLTTYGKSLYLNRIQQPFFERTKLIRNQYNGRIDKFMGDNVMCVFLDEATESHRITVLHNFLAIFSLCRVLLNLLKKGNLMESRLGLRSGATYGSQILRSNLGNEILRDFTVTGESVNLASRLEHISVDEMMLNNKSYFEATIHRFPQIQALLSLAGNCDSLSPETRQIVNDFTLYQNISSNLEKLKKIRFDIRFNQAYYKGLKQTFEKYDIRITNPEKAGIYGYESYEVQGFELRFYYSFYVPKGFKDYEIVWILPLETELLENLDIEKLGGTDA